MTCLRKPWLFILAVLMLAAPVAALAQPPAAPAPSASPAPQQPVPPAPPNRARPAAPAGDQPPQPLFGESIEVRVVNVEAVVTDKKGNRVPDLKAGDFRLTVDGKQVPIQYFTEVRGGDAIAPAGGEAAPVPGLPSLAPGSPVGTSYLVFVDDVFAIGPRRDEVLRNLKDSLSRLGPEDRMAIVSFDGRHIQMLSTWSNSTRTLGRAIDQAIGNRAHGLDRLSELRSFESTQRLVLTTAALPQNLVDNHLNLEEIDYASRLGDQLRDVVAAAVSTMRAFSSPPGRKVMLLLAGGWPYSPADYAVNDIRRPIISREVPRGEEIMGPLVQTANKIGYTLYPVDVPGLGQQMADASADQVLEPEGLSLREQETKTSLLTVAQETGGKALLNGLRMQALERVETDTRSYYWLGFSPDWKGNDKSHKVKLEVARPGLQVRARDSFLDNSRHSEVSMMVESAMLFGNPSGSTMPVKLGSPSRSGRKEMELPVTLAIPTSSFTSVPINGKFASELELRIAALDDRGGRSDIPVIPIRFSTKEQPAQGKYLPWEVKLKLRRTGQHLTFAVFDPLSNKITTAEADVKP